MSLEANFSTGDTLDASQESLVRWYESEGYRAMLAEWETELAKLETNMLNCLNDKDSSRLHRLTDYWVVYRFFLDALRYRPQAAHQAFMQRAGVEELPHDPLSDWR